MTVHAVGQENKSPLGTIITSTGAGLAAGYAMKCWWPITPQEDKYNRRIFINSCHKLANDSKMEEIYASKVKSPAKDEFIRLAQSKDKKAFCLPSIAERVKALGGEDSAAGKELRALVRSANEASRALRRDFSVAYRIMLKKTRPVIPFLVTGAGAGFLAGFARNVMRDDV